MIAFVGGVGFTYEKRCRVSIPSGKVQTGEKTLELGVNETLYH